MESNILPGYSVTLTTQMILPSAVTSVSAFHEQSNIQYSVRFPSNITPSRGLIVVNAVAILRIRYNTCKTIAIVALV